MTRHQPQDEVLARVLNACATVLATAVTPEDSFFGLGGDSVSAMHVIAELAAESITGPEEGLFTAASLREFAALCAPGGRAGPAGPGVMSTVARDQLAALAHGGPAGALYLEQLVVAIAGLAEPRRLAGAFQRLAERHAVLRTWVRGDGEIVTEPFAVIPVRFLPAAGEGPIADDPAVRRALAADRAEGLRPDVAPPCRVTVFTAGGRPVGMILTLRSALLDGWALAELLSGLGSLLAETGPAADAAPWTAQTVSGDEARAYWAARLAGLPRQEPLLAAGAPGAPGSLRFERLVVEPEIMARLARRCRDERVTVATAVRAAVALALRRLSGTVDAVFAEMVCGGGAPHDAPVRNKLLSFADRVAVPDSGSTGDWLREVQRHGRDARRHAGIPLADQLRCGGQPNVEVLLAVENLPVPGIPAPAGPARSGPARGGPAPGGPVSLSVEAVIEATPFPVFLAALPGERLVLSAAWWQAADDEVVAALLEHVARGLGELATAGSMAGIFPRATAEDRRRIEAANSTAHPLPGARVEDLIESAARRNPDHLAILDGERALTFAGVAAATDAIAAGLAAHGVGDGDVVAVIGRRGADAVLALAGILKAGAVYLPVELPVPAVRARAVLAESGAVFGLVAGATVAEVTAAGIGGPPLVAVGDVSAPGTTAAGTPGGPAAGTAHGPAAGMPGGPAAGAARNPAAPAYLMYTSGSTGGPKGVLTSHRSLVNRLVWMASYLAVTEDDHIAHKTPIGFDVSLWEMLLPLITGARLVVARPPAHQDPAQISRLLVDQRITICHFVPSMLQQLLHHLGAAGLRSSLRYLVCSGEVLPADVAAAAGGQLGCAVVNLYGPTEAAIDVTAWMCRPGDPRTTVPIGHPIWNTEANVVDADGQDVPPGAVGELALGGAGLAIGYLGRPRETAARFVPAAGGLRRYLTGDVARRRADGAIEYLGRRDLQVKVRGVRVEIEEVEAAIRAVDGVADGAVVAVGGPDGTRLGAVAEAAASPGRPTVTWDAVRAALTELLPAAFVPTVGAVTGELPHTPSGKIDRAAVARYLLGDGGLGDGGAAAPPHGGLAATPPHGGLAATMAAVLGRPVPDRTATFLELGGDSLLAARLATDLRNGHLIDIGVAEILGDGSLASLERAARAAAGPAAPVPGAVTAPRWRPLTRAERRLWLAHELEPDPGVFNIVTSCWIEGPLDAGRLAQAVRRLADGHPVLRSRLEVRAGVPGATADESCRLALEPIDARGAGRDGAWQRACAGAAEPFQLERGPWHRARLYEIEDSLHLLCWSAHHIGADAGSAGVIVTELAASYAGGQVPPPPTGAAPEEEAAAGALGYWVDQLRDVPELSLAAAGGFAAPPHGTAGRVEARLDATAAAAIQRTARQLGMTPFMLLISVWEMVLAHHTGQPDFAVVVPYSGARPQGSIGFFVNMLPVRCDVPGGGTVRDLLRRVRQRVLGGYANSSADFGDVVRAVPAAAGRRHHGFGVAAQWLRDPLGEASLGGLTIRDAEVRTGRAIYDLNLVALESAAGVRLVLDHASAVVSRARAEEIVDETATLLRRVPDLLDVPLHAVDAGSPERRAMVRQALAGPGRPVGARSFDELFTARVRLCPGAVAVRDHDGHISYGDLDVLAEAAAAELRRREVPAEGRVGVLGERSRRVVAASISVMRAGAAFLLLDPGLPESRLRSAVTRAGVEVILVCDPSLRPLAETLGPAVVDLWRLGAAA